MTALSFKKLMNSFYVPLVSKVQGYEIN